MKSPSVPAPTRGSQPVTTPIRIDGQRSRANVVRSHPLPSANPMSVTSTSYAGTLLQEIHRVLNSNRSIDLMSVGLQQGLHEFATVRMILHK